MRNITRQLLTPRTSVISRSFNYYPLSKADVPNLESITSTTLLPNNEEHFRLFEQILTSELVLPTSSWIHQWFDSNKVKKHCDNFNKRISLAAELDGEEDVEGIVSKELLQRFKNGESSTQLAIDNFFSLPKNTAKLRNIYQNITAHALDDGLGYYVFRDSKNDLIGGGALAPISENYDTDKKVDVAIHIFNQKRGVGKLIMNILLKKAFEELGVSEVWGTSIREHPATPKICSSYGMIIQYNEEKGMRYYLMTDKMWQATKENLDRIKREPVAASTFYSPLDNSIKK